jgi:ferredoxin
MGVSVTESVKAYVDRNECKGHGLCYMKAPDVFDCDDDGFPLVIGDATTADQIEELRRAVSNCPEQAITTSSD